MHVAGGFYKEICSIPNWDAEFGSGGRAAAAISAYVQEITLHTYVESTPNNGIKYLNNLGVEVLAHPRASNIVFAYFHPLSRPFIEPNPLTIFQLPPINVTGDAVLRFGFIEGDAVINADRAVYDPQTWHNAPAFQANGSSAQELAIVLNELELKSAAQCDDLMIAASLLMEAQDASCVIAKQGVRGATVFERNGQTTHIACYRSSRVFKIGTGDIFSAIFSYYWAEKRISAVKAADFASRAVAAYCSNRGTFPLNKDAHINQIAWKSGKTAAVKLEGSTFSLGQRYTLEEASFVLRELGIEVVCPALGNYSKLTASATLVLADGIGKLIDSVIEEASKTGKPIIVLCEDKSTIPSLNSFRHVNIIDDFSSSLYLAAWNAYEHSK